MLIALCLGGATPVFLSDVAVAASDNPARVRAFAKLPYWPGIWEQYDIGPSGTPTSSTGKAQVFGNDAAKTNGLRPVFTDAWLERMKTEVKHRPGTDKVCTFGFPWLMEAAPLMFQFIITPEETTIVFNLREIRHLYTDGKGHTPEDIRLITPWGDSIGHWEGETLVADTIGTSGRIWFDDNGKIDSTVLSNQSVYHERLRMLDANTLEERITVEDPVAFKESWSFTRQYHHVPNMSRIVEEEDCEGGNDRNQLIDGKWTITPPAP